jgi:hypothetical protein
VAKILGLTDQEAFESKGTPIWWTEIVDSQIWLSSLLHSTIRTI